ncbi:MAG: hypothetical protein M3524_12580, partial [Actinomycetota bacterium]|nr:hypothetical protein [Actinomycetota bacterium]
FEVAPLFFSGGLIGLRLLAGTRAGSTGRIGGWVAFATLLSAVVDIRLFVMKRGSRSGRGSLGNA